MAPQGRGPTPDMIEDQRAKALTQAAIQAGRALGLGPVETCTILGVPQGAFKDMQKGTRLVDGNSGEAERADALVRIVKRLKALLGDQETLWRSWIRQPCESLDDKPLTVMLQKYGAEKVVAYLDRARSLAAKSS